MLMKFKPSQLMNKPLKERDKLIDRSSMEQLANDIINSVQISLSSEAEVQQVKALEGLDDTSLVTEFPPMKWTTQEQDAEWEQYVQSQAELKRLK